MADQSASLATKIPTRRRESVPRAMYCTISNVMRRKYAQNPPMTVNPVRISILGPKVTTTNMKRSIKIHFYISTRKKAHNGGEENFKLSATRFYGKDRLSCEIAEAVILRSRKGDVCNLKSEWHDPPLIQVRRQVQRGL